MPIYDVLCPECEKEWEDYAPVEGKDLIPCPFCYEREDKRRVHGITQITIKSKPKVYGNQMGEVDPGLGEYVASEEDRQRIMKENNLIEVGDAHCTTSHLNDTELSKQRKEIDGELEHYNFSNINIKSEGCGGFGASDDDRGVTVPNSF